MCEWVIQHLCLIPSACMLVSVTPLCLRTCIHIRRFSSFWIRNMGLGKCFGRGSLAGGQKKERGREGGREGGQKKERGGGGGGGGGGERGREGQNMKKEVREKKEEYTVFGD